MDHDISIPRRVAIYGRVSTEHEAQLSAFENQKDWYESLAAQHPNWNIVARYYDEGTTGTATKKRPAFLNMLADARKKSFDLIVTREVCRFARNTVDTLTVTRELSSIGIEVYFVQDNIWTMDGDGELRLTIMATLAQEESRKISERVRAGQKISREKGVLYGNGNILGYDLINGSYKINPEQAYTVRKIFELYASGLGYKRICAELVRLGCKNAHDEVDWKVDRIGRILRNATYKGYIGYNKSHSDGYLTQKRINHMDEDFIYIKGNFEPIVSEELWNKCAEIRSKKSARQRDSDGKLRKFGRKEPESIWTSKLRCSCGSSYCRFLWHKNENGRKTYGYECYRKKRNASRTYLEKHGLDTSRICTSKSIPYWHIDMMALAVFQTVWKKQSSAVLLACQMIESCSSQEQDGSKRLINALEEKLQKLLKKQQGLRSMCAMGDISREEFLADNQIAQTEIDRILSQIEDLKHSETNASTGIDIAQIRQILNQWIDLSGPTISDALINQFILQVIVVDDNTFNFTLNLSVNGESHPRASEIAMELYREKQRADKASPTASVDTMLDKHITDPQELLSFTITEDYARNYCHSIGMKFFAKKWHDKTVIISL